MSNISAVQQSIAQDSALLQLQALDAVATFISPSQSSSNSLVTLTNSIANKVVVSEMEVLDSGISSAFVAILNSVIASIVY